jgi:hypothetical protein
VVDGATHDNDLLDLEKGLGVLCSSDSDICQGSPDEDADSVGRLLAKNAEDLLVTRSLRRSEEWRSGVGGGLVVEKGLPGLGRCEMRMSFIDIVKAINTV